MALLLPPKPSLAVLSLLLLLVTSSEAFTNMGSSAKKNRLNNNNNKSALSMAGNPCPEIPLKPKTPGNGLACLACGEAPNPNYQNIQDSTEAFIVEYNPDKLSYRDILEEWSDLDYPLMQQKTQYRSAVFTLDEEQQAEAEAFVKELAAKNADKGRIYCTVEPVTKFYRGEEYHQDFLAKQSSSKTLRMF